MTNSLKDKIKYGLLKFIDLSGFKVFDPPVRLAFGEDPKKQISEIGKYMILPTLFVGICVLMWAAIAPTHKTKSGAVPTPAKVLVAYSDNNRLSEREAEKVEDFEAAGEVRSARLAEVQKRIPELQAKSAELEKKSKQAATEGERITEKKLAPLEAKLASLRAIHQEQKAARKLSYESLAQQVAAKESSTDEILTLATTQKATTEAEKEKETLLKNEIKEIRDNPPESIKAAQTAANKVADEIQHYKRRLDILTVGNKEAKKQQLLAKIAEDEKAITSSTDPKEIAKLTKTITKNRENAETQDEKKFAKNATIAWQTKRSLATVFVGFVLAAMVAIPLGIMCGLNKIVMACMTPIISIFRPVSPVVWLLIFQIVVGALFLPDPAKHPLFVSMNQEYWFGWIKNPISFLETNPAMIFSACTVAMCALWPALVNTALGVSAIDKDHLNVARVLKLGFWSRLFKIIIPSSLPLVFAGLRISLGVGWMVLIAAEALSSSDGLGKFVWDEYQNGSSQSFANIILACFIVGIIGFFLDRVMIILQKLVSFDDGSATA
ncbi:MAG: ABC transporter permease subunit [Akkermansiaceae bacterium]